VEAQRAYDTGEVTARLREAVQRVAKPSSTAEESRAGPQGQPQGPPQDQTEADPPRCPRCAGPMVLRQAKRHSPHKREQFWGCPHFPKCRGTRELEEAGSGPPDE
jgi:restriction system protein